MSDYKPHLDKAADRVKHPQPSPPSEEQQQQQGGLMQKVEQVTRNIPLVGTMLGSTNETEKNNAATQPEKTVAPSGPPDRPEHDAQIEEFLKDQHHSRKVVGDDQGPVS
ncbi:hypothetical protein QBC35DRAFT_482296 [Podospora australis]|uniref:Uncharacterized protein n=1 Tax=Podospora australis TaxID=1536484 RepID=A0AAN7ANU6_9PEZI|nr:hypothetical protein QBC35DRAFT_482296 [Podospora australis]